ncbi:hypothetical protein Bhyg_15279 [Pseudolycoriella hygida]|uniref:Uncharacterized protein n=1 Tax=Pseudolycoriella hygida TaxID=35572 RepID=A0A9Q0RY34_9DIPT|nr:hypothetical protein Bhyg_15279 [Pseudolycoriella hygida]
MPKCSVRVNFIMKNFSLREITKKNMKIKILIYLSVGNLNKNSNRIAYATKNINLIHSLLLTKKTPVLSLYSSPNPAPYAFHSSIVLSLKCSRHSWSSTWVLCRSTNVYSMHVRSTTIDVGIKFLCLVIRTLISKSEVKKIPARQTPRRKPPLSTFGKLKMHIGTHAHVRIFSLECKSALPMMVLSKKKLIPGENYLHYNSIQRCPRKTLMWSLLTNNLTLQLLRPFRQDDVQRRDDIGRIQKPNVEHNNCLLQSGSQFDAGSFENINALLQFPGSAIGFLQIDNQNFNLALKTTLLLFQIVYFNNEGFDVLFLLLNACRVFATNLFNFFSASSRFGIEFGVPLLSFTCYTQNKILILYCGHVDIRIISHKQRKKSTKPNISANRNEIVLRVFGLCILIRRGWEGIRTLINTAVIQMGTFCYRSAVSISLLKISKNFDGFDRLMSKSNFMVEDIRFMAVHSKSYFDCNVTTLKSNKN